MERWIGVNLKAVIRVAFASKLNLWDLIVHRFEKVINYGYGCFIDFLLLDVSFRRQRAAKEGSSNYEADLNAGTVAASDVAIPVTNKANGVKFNLQVICLEDGTFRVKMNEANPLLPRYEVEHALLPELPIGK